MVVQTGSQCPNFANNNCNLQKACFLFTGILINGLKTIEGFTITKFTKRNIFCAKLKAKVSKK